LLIMDEPTAGLDPHQIHQVRELIKSLGRKHTLLLSTHILPEVEVTCDSVIILNRGRIICSDRIANLTRRGPLRVEIHGPQEQIKQWLSHLPGVKGLEVRLAPKRSVNGSGFLTQPDRELLQCQIETDGTDFREQIYLVAAKAQWSLRELTQERLSLEEIFMKAVATDADEVEE